jgi:hypothetical protein
MLCLSGVLSQVSSHQPAPLHENHPAPLTVFMSLTNMAF